MYAAGLGGEQECDGKTPRLRQIGSEREAKGRTSRGQRKVEPKPRGADEEDSDDLSRGLRGTEEEEFGAGGGNEPEGCAGK